MWSLSSLWFFAHLLNKSALKFICYAQYSLWWILDHFESPVLKVKAVHHVKDVSEKWKWKSLTLPKWIVHTRRVFWNKLARNIKVKKTISKVSHFRSIRSSVKVQTRHQKGAYNESTQIDLKSPSSCFLFARFYPSTFTKTFRVLTILVKYFSSSFVSLCHWLHLLLNVRAYSVPVDCVYSCGVFKAILLYLFFWQKHTLLSWVIVTWH